MAKRKRKDPKTGRFVESIRPQKRRHITELAKDLRTPLTEIAKMKEVSLETVIRLAKGRLSKRQIQQLYFETVKTDLKTVVKLFASRKKQVTVKAVIEYMQTCYQVELTRHIVSKALRTLANEGVEINRPVEYESATVKMRRKKKALETTDAKIVELREKFLDIRDVDLAKKVGLNYYALRKRITAMKKSGKIPNVRRGYKQK